MQRGGDGVLTFVCAFCLTCNVWGVIWSVTLCTWRGAFLWKFSRVSALVHLVFQVTILSTFENLCLHLVHLARGQWQKHRL
jgi:hypothetical protein